MISSCSFVSLGRSRSAVTNYLKTIIVNNSNASLASQSSNIRCVPVPVLQNQYLHFSTRKIQDMSFTVTIVRHGQTDFNLKNLVHSSSDGTINETGRAEAEKLGKFLADEQYTTVYSSDLQRCQDTAEGVLKHLKVPAPQVVLDKRLREMDFAEWDGRPMKDLFLMAREQKIDVRKLSAPGGETYEEARNRVVHFFDDLFKLRDETDNDANVIIFTHGICISLFLTYIDSKKDAIEVENFISEEWKFSGNTARTKFVVGRTETGLGDKRKLTFTCHHDQSHLDESYAAKPLDKRFIDILKGQHQQ